MESLVDFTRLGGILPKTITKELRKGNAPWRTIETPAGMLNSIGLDNDGINAFVAHHLPYLASLGTAIVVSIAGRTHVTSSSKWSRNSLSMRPWTRSN